MNTTTHLHMVVWSQYLYWIAGTLLHSIQDTCMNTGTGMNMNIQNWNYNKLPVVQIGIPTVLYCTFLIQPEKSTVNLQQYNRYRYPKMEKPVPPYQKTCYRTSSKTILKNL